MISTALRRGLAGGGNNYAQMCEKMHLQNRDSQIKLLHVIVVLLRSWQSLHRFHARRRAPVLHFMSQEF